MRVVRRRRKHRVAKRLDGIGWALLGMPALYLLGALIGSLIPVNRSWDEPAQGTTVYLADNGVHVDIIMPVRRQGLDWAQLLPRGAWAPADPDARFIAFGAGEQHVYLDTPTWSDLSPRTLWFAMTGGKRVIHAQYVQSPAYAVRQIRLRPEEYRRLWAAIRADLVLDENGRAKRLDHPGYGPSDGFFEARGKASAIRTCNSWVADKLRLAGVKTSLWPPFAKGVVWRYRKADQRT